MSYRDLLLQKNNDDEIVTELNSQIYPADYKNRFAQGIENRQKRWEFLHLKEMTKFINLIDFSSEIPRFTFNYENSNHQKYKVVLDQREYDKKTLTIKRSDGAEILINILLNIAYNYAQFDYQYYTFIEVEYSNNEHHSLLFKLTLPESMFYKLEDLPVEDFYECMEKTYFRTYQDDDSGVALQYDLTPEMLETNEDGTFKYGPYILSSDGQEVLSIVNKPIYNLEDINKLKKEIQYINSMLYGAQRYNLKKRVNNLKELKKKYDDQQQAISYVTLEVPKIIASSNLATDLVNLFSKKELLELYDVFLKRTTFAYYQKQVRNNLLLKLQRFISKPR